ncbi:uncharacterized [Tachysurus ichikawai]
MITLPPHVSFSPPLSTERVPTSTLSPTVTPAVYVMFERNAAQDRECRRFHHSSCFKRRTTFAHFQHPNIPNTTPFTGACNHSNTFLFAAPIS